MGCRKDGIRMGKYKTGHRRMVLMAVLLIVALEIPMGVCALQIPEFYEIQNGEESKPYQYGSRCQCAFSVWAADLEERIWSGWNAPEIWNLAEEGKPDDPGIAAYSLTAEPVTGMEEVCKYKEAYLQGREGNKLRAIMLQSFPYLSLDELENRVNGMLGEGAAESLTEGEAICAAQQAIWKVWYADRFESEKLYVSIRGISQYQPSRFLYPESLQNSTEQESTERNIQNLYRYYLSLAGDAPAQEGEISFTDVSYASRQRADGTTAVTVTFGINANRQTEHLYVTVRCGNFYRREPVQEKQVQMQFTGLEKEEAVILMLDGIGQELQAFQYLPEGEGPVLIGCRTQNRRMFAQMQIGPEEEKADRVIVIHMEPVMEMPEIACQPMILMGIGIVLICIGVMVAVRCMGKDGS